MSLRLEPQATRLFFQRPVQAIAKENTQALQNFLFVRDQNQYQL